MIIAQSVALARQNLDSTTVDCADRPRKTWPSRIARTGRGTDATDARDSPVTDAQDDAAGTDAVDADTAAGSTSLVSDGTSDGGSR